MSVAAAAAEMAPQVDHNFCSMCDKGKSAELLSQKCLHCPYCTRCLVCPKCQYKLPVPVFYCGSCLNPVVDGVPPDAKMFMPLMSNGLSPGEARSRLLALASFLPTLKQFKNTELSWEERCLLVRYSNVNDNRRVSDAKKLLSWKLLPREEAGLREVIRTVLERLDGSDRLKNAKRKFTKEDGEKLLDEIRKFVGPAYVVDAGRMCEKVNAMWRRPTGQTILMCPRKVDAHGTPEPLETWHRRMDLAWLTSHRLITCRRKGVVPTPTYVPGEHPPEVVAPPEPAEAPAFEEGSVEALLFANVKY